MNQINKYNRPFFLLTISSLSLLLFLFYGLFSKPSWEAVSTIRTATISGLFIESPAETVDRLRSPSAIYRVLELSNQQKNEGNFKDLLKATRIAMIGDSIQLRVNAKTAEEAISRSWYYLKTIQDQQSELLSERAKDVITNGPQILARKAGDNKINSTWSHHPELIKSINQYPSSFSVQPSTFPYPVNISYKLLALLGFSVGLLLGFGCIYLNILD